MTSHEQEVLFTRLRDDLTKGLKLMMDAHDVRDPRFREGAGTIQGAINLCNLEIPRPLDDIL
jgi:hypothetical protein